MLVLSMLTRINVHGELHMLPHVLAVYMCVWFTLMLRLEKCRLRE